jgi:uncharacterized membrane protein YbhN (UPF0104 family)
MQDALQASTRFLRTQINWHRVGVTIGLTIMVVAAIVLYRLLSDIEPREVLAALTGAETRDLIAAAFFVAVGYLTLTFYDYFALHTIGRADVPYRVAALAGFTSYSIGHNVGFSIFSGGSVRYRVYSSSSSLSALEVAKICLIAGFTFWLGNIAVLGLGFAIEPEAATAVDRLPPIVNRALGGLALLMLAGYVAWASVAPRRIGYGSWALTLPSGRLTFIQILLGIVDLTCAAAAMYMLMPDQPAIDFIGLAVIFVTATLLGFASHTPGGLGVFDVTMLLALQLFDKEELVGAVLLFRLLYYIVPLALSLVIIGAREFALDLKPLLNVPRRLDPDVPAFRAETKPRGGHRSSRERPTPRSRARKPVGKQPRR